MDEQTNVTPVAEPTPPVMPVEPTPPATPVEPVTPVEPEIPARPEAPQADLTKPELNAPHYAGGWIRFLAIIIDGIILAVIAWIISMIFFSNLSTLDDASVAQNVQRLISIIYFFLFIALKQQTPGMMVLKLRTISLDTNQRSWWLISLLREVLGTLVCGITLGIGYLIIFWTPKKQGLHDYIAGTTVIRE
jgi:uncharacterized RDD family membrane protein YckC